MSFDDCLHGMLLNIRAATAADAYYEPLQKLCATALEKLKNVGESDSLYVTHNLRHCSNLDIALGRNSNNTVHGSPSTGANSITELQPDFVIAKGQTVTAVIQEKLHYHWLDILSPVEVKPHPFKNKPGSEEDKMPTSYTADSGRKSTVPCVEISDERDVHLSEVYNLAIDGVPRSKAPQSREANLWCVISLQLNALSKSSVTWAIPQTHKTIYEWRPNRTRPKIQARYVRYHCYKSNQTSHISVQRTLGAIWTTKTTGEATSHRLSFSADFTGPRCSDVLLLASTLLTFSSLVCDVGLTRPILLKLDQGASSTLGIMTAKVPCSRMASTSFMTFPVSLSYCLLCSVLSAPIGASFRSSIPKRTPRRPISIPRPSPRRPVLIPRPSPHRPVLGLVL